jgi:hypothetical protein
MSHRVIKHIVDPDTNENLVKVPLSDAESPEHATLNALDYEDLIENGASPLWRLRKDRGKVRVVVGLPPLRQDIAVSRLVTGAKENQSVTFIDGDATNLRAKNLVLSNGRGLRCERDLLSPQRHGFGVRHILKHEYYNKNGDLIP